MPRLVHAGRAVAYEILESGAQLANSFCTMSWAAEESDQFMPFLAVHSFSTRSDAPIWKRDLNFQESAGVTSPVSAKLLR